jgi:glycosyltransferase involved in cell wall biosynthesis
MRTRRRVYFYVGKLAHPVYREQFMITPAGFRYLASSPDLEDVATFGPAVARRLTLAGKLERHAKTAIVGALAMSGYVRTIVLNPPDETALVHSGQYLLKNPTRPYVVDFEDVHVFCFYQHLALERAWAKTRLSAAVRDPACRYLLPWSETARRGFLAALDPATRADVADRTVTVRPAIRPTAAVPRRRGSDPLRIAFVGTRFFEKGGAEAMLAIRLLRQTHAVELDMVSSVPDPWRRAVDGDGAIRIYDWLSPKDIRGLFDRSHALLFPTHIDTFGYVVLEALAAAMPVIAPDHHALPELVEDGVSGLLFPHENSLFLPNAQPRYRLFVPPVAPRSFIRGLGSPSEPYIERIATKLARLAEDRDEYERLSAGALASVVTGVFSAPRRRQELSEIYKNALS